MLTQLLRMPLIQLSKSSWAQGRLTGWEWSRRAARRFVAGEQLADALEAISALNAKGINVTLDHLGENTSTLEEAAQAAAEVARALAVIHSAGLRANVSVKLSQLGLAVSEDVCRENLRVVLRAAQAAASFVRIDMEDSASTSATLRMVRWAHEQGFGEVGVVLQSYLYRTERDARELAAEGIGVRLCKGAYLEPLTVAFAKKAAVDANYDRVARLLMKAARAQGAHPGSADGVIPPLTALATHDPVRIANAQAAAAELGLPQAAVEFQMLYGIRRDLQEQLVGEGWPVRVYVPYGARWYPYFMRRLAERPANVWFFVSNYFQ